MKENVDIFDFELTHAEVGEIKTLDIGKSLFG
jgi:diketogulonate reductase-like aldo/keto reductase